MAQFDPKSRRETRLLRQLFVDDRGRPVYEMLPYCWVEYDGNPDRYLEALPVEDYGPNDRITNPLADGVGQIVGFEVITGRLSEVFALNDFRAET